VKEGGGGIGPLSKVKGWGLTQVRGTLRHPGGGRGGKEKERRKKNPYNRRRKNRKRAAAAGPIVYLHRRSAIGARWGGKRDWLGTNFGDKEKKNAQKQEKMGDKRCKFGGPLAHRVKNSG